MGNVVSLVSSSCDEVSELSLRLHAYVMYFQGCKSDNFQMKKIDIFLIFALRILDCCLLLTVDCYFGFIITCTCICSNTYWRKTYIEL